MRARHVRPGVRHRYARNAQGRAGPRASRADRRRPAGHWRHGRRGRADGARGGRPGGRHGLCHRVDLPGRTPEADGNGRLLAAPIRQMSRTRRARVRALAKINLDLRVLGKRPDGFHELRTIFQTISLTDTIEIAFTASPRTEIELEDKLAIPDNLVTRAARLTLDRR